MSKVCPFKIGDRVVFLANIEGTPVWTFASYFNGVLPERTQTYSGGIGSPLVGSIQIEGTVEDIDDSDRTFRIEWEGGQYRHEWWFTFAAPDPSELLADGWPRLAGRAEATSQKILTPDHTQSVSVGRLQQVPDRIIAEMTARGENHPRRTLTRWPYNRRWVADAGVRREGAGECGQDLFTISWRWEDIPQRD
jgi:hypothetical protein